MAKKIEIQALDQRCDKWETIHLSEIRFSDNALYLGGPFKILVNDEVIFSTLAEEKEDV